MEALSEWSGVAKHTLLEAREICYGLVDGADSARSREGVAEKQSSVQTGTSSANTAGSHEADKSQPAATASQPDDAAGAGPSGGVRDSNDAGAGASSSSGPNDLRAAGMTVDTAATAVTGGSAAAVGLSP